MCFENLMEKGENSVNQHFPLFPQYFLPYHRKIAPFEPNSPFAKQALVFTCLQYKSSENTKGKGEIARNEQFVLYLQCFLPVWRTFCHCKII